MTEKHLSCCHRASPQPHVSAPCTCSPAPYSVTTCNDTAAGAWRREDDALVSKAIRDSIAASADQEDFSAAALLGLTQDELSRAAKQFGGQKYRGKQLLDKLKQGCKSIADLEQVCCPVLEDVVQAPGCLCLCISIQCAQSCCCCPCLHRWSTQHHALGAGAQVNARGDDRCRCNNRPLPCCWRAGQQRWHTQVPVSAA